MPNQITKKEWRACRFLIRTGSSILAPGIFFGIIGVYFQVKYEPILLLLSGLVIAGILCLGAGYSCKLFWKRKHMRRP